MVKEDPMTTEAHVPTTLASQGERVTPVDAGNQLDPTFDPNETCDRCGPCTRARVRGVFAPVSPFTNEHIDLYLCAHCSSVSEPRLLTTSILNVARID
jgi:hypothetical protein